MAGTVATASKLPAELQLLTIGFAVAGNHPIDIKHFHKYLDILTAPFSANAKLLAIAEDECLKSNTFMLNGDDTTVNWIPADIGQTESRWPTTQPATNMLPEGSHNPTVGLNFSPSLFSEGLMSTDIKYIRHFEVHFSIISEGLYAEDEDGPATIGKEATKLLKCLSAVFPHLESLDVVVEDVGAIHPDANYFPGGGWIWARSFPEEVVRERMEKAADFINVVAGLEMGSARRFRKMVKTLTFVHKICSEGDTQPTEIVSYEPDADGKLPTVDELRVYDRVQIEF